MKGGTNIYKKARTEAQMTQETAAEAVGVSLTSLKEYESCSRIPPICIVERMCVAYGSRALAYQHMRLISGKIQVVPEVEERDLQAATIRLVNQILSFGEKRRDRQLLQIAEDGTISPEERPLFDAILQELQSLIQASTELTLARAREGSVCLR